MTTIFYYERNYSEAAPKSSNMCIIHSLYSGHIYYIYIYIIIIIIIILGFSRITFVNEFQKLISCSLIVFTLSVYKCIT